MYIYICIYIYVYIYMYIYICMYIYIHHTTSISPEIHHQWHNGDIMGIYWWCNGIISHYITPIMSGVFFSRGSSTEANRKMEIARPRKFLGLAKCVPILDYFNHVRSKNNLPATKNHGMLDHNMSIGWGPWGSGLSSAKSLGPFPQKSSKDTRQKK